MKQACLFGEARGTAVPPLHGRGTGSRLFLFAEAFPLSVSSFGMGFCHFDKQDSSFSDFSGGEDPRENISKNSCNMP
jgi:hypothetical protein